MSTVFRNGEKNGDLQLMAEYDFNAPIKATVILYDSDDDNVLSTEEEQYNNPAKSTEHNVCDISENMYIANKIYHEVTNIINGGMPNDLENSSKSVKIVENVTKDSNTQLGLQKQANVSTENQPVNNMAFNKNILEDQSLNSNEILATTLQGSSERHPLVSSPHTAVPQNEKYNINEKVDTCLQTILDTVSTHMMLIMQAYKDYTVVISRTSDRAVIDSAKKHFQDAKSKFFYLSFSAVSNLLLPKENDTAFMEIFIDNTIKLANSKHFYFRHSDMKSLCSEMFNWTKSHLQHPLIMGLLTNKSQPPVPKRNTNRCQKEQDCNRATNALDNACVFRSGPAGRELTINVNSAFIQNNQNTIPQLHNTSHVPVNVPSRPSALPTRCSHKLRKNAPYSRSNVQEFPNYNTHYDSNGSQFPYQKCNSQNNKYLPQRHHATLPTQTPINPPPSYESTQAWRQETVMPLIHSDNQIINRSPAGYNIFQPDQGQVEENRSLSRDSGFMSPLRLGSNDQMCTSPEYDLSIGSSSTLVTPMITHVTSLNPAVAFIKDGICHVCGKLSKQKCLGCYKLYYCSHQCQVEDWKYHAFICK